MPKRSPIFPLPISPAYPITYESAPSDTIYNDKGDIRSDYYVTPKITVFGRYSQLNTRIFSPPNIPGPSGGNANGNVYVQTYEGVGGFTWTASATSILEFRSVATIAITASSFDRGSSPPMASPFPTSPLDPSYAGGLLTASAGSFSQFGRQGSNPQYQYPLVYDPKVNYTRDPRPPQLENGLRDAGYRH